jgi:hypothetical protein
MLSGLAFPRRWCGQRTVLPLALAAVALVLVSPWQPAAPPPLPSPLAHGSGSESTGTGGEGSSEGSPQAPGGDLGLAHPSPSLSPSVQPLEGRTGASGEGTAAQEAGFGGEQLASGPDSPESDPLAASVTRVVGLGVSPAQAQAPPLEGALPVGTRMDLICGVIQRDVGREQGG